MKFVANINPLDVITQNPQTKLNNIWAEKMVAPTLQIGLIIISADDVISQRIVTSLVCKVFYVVFLLGIFFCKNEFFGLKIFFCAKIIF